MTGRPNIDIVIDCHDVDLLLEFWAAALGYRKIGSKDQYGLLLPDDPTYPPVILQRVPEPKTAKDRLHVDVTLEPGQEVTDLLALGATVVTAPDEQDWWVLADPEGHEFCVFLPQADATNDADAEVPAS